MEMDITNTGIRNWIFDGNISDAATSGDSQLCFDLLVQKATTLAGDPLDLQFYREKVFEYCSIPSAVTPMDFTVLVHSGNRVFHKRDELAKFLSGHSLLRNMQGPFFENPGGKTFCEQVALIAKSRVVMAHHGAEVAGLGVFLSRNALFIEIEKREGSLHEIGRTSNFDLFKSLGIRYIGARIAFPVTRTSLASTNSSKGCHLDYYQRRECEVALEREKLHLVLMKAQNLLQLK